MNITKNFKKKIFTKETIISLMVTIIIFILDRLSKLNIIKKTEQETLNTFKTEVPSIDFHHKDEKSFKMAMAQAAGRDSVLILIQRGENGYYVTLEP